MDAEEWYAAWNSHDLERILSHYDEAIEFTSPFAEKLTQDGSGTVAGKAALREYFWRALVAFPDLHFVPERTLLGVGSVVLCYRSVRNLRAAEMMLLGPDGRIVRVWAHYAAGD